MCFQLHLPNFILWNLVEQIWGEYLLLAMKMIGKTLAMAMYMQSETVTSLKTRGMQLTSHGPKISFVD